MDEITPNAGSGWIKDVACPRQDYCVGGGSFYNKSNKTNLIIIGTGVDPNNPTNAYSGTFEAHEFTHSIQQSISDEARPPINLLASPWPPNWYWEGLAQFSQHAAIYSDSFEDYLDFRRRSTGELFKNSRWNSNEIEAYLQTNLTPEWEAKYPRWRMYDLGAMFVEILVSIKSRNLVNSLDFKIVLFVLVVLLVLGRVSWLSRNENSSCVKLRSNLYRPTGVGNKL